jgi:hypothetical protein
MSHPVFLQDIYDVYIRPSYYDAAIALNQIDKVSDDTLYTMNWDLCLTLYVYKIKCLLVSFFSKNSQR